MTRVAKIPDTDDYAIEAAEAAQAAETRCARLEREVARLQSELNAVRSVLKTTCRICLPYYVEK